VIAGVVIDAWKLPIFKRYLDEAGYTYTEHPGITPDTLTLKVTYVWVHKLHQIVKLANDECAAKGLQKPVGPK
jgi:hypothetical protein